MRVSRTHIAGDLGVAAGVKHPGTAIPRAAGFDPATKKIRWDQPLPAVDLSTVRQRGSEWDALAGGRYISSYGTGQDGWHITALDARTGDRLWDTTLRPIFAVDKIDDLMATEGHVFVVRTSSLEIFDAHTGKLRGTIGHETYD